MAEQQEQRVGRWDAAAGLLQNFVTKMGTERARKQQNAVGERVIFNDGQLNVLEQHGLVKRINGELPADAGSKPEIVSSDDTAAMLEQELRNLKARQKFRQAGSMARGYGGAAIWICCEGGGETNEPLDLKTVKRVKNLVVINRYELSPAYEVKSGDGTDSQMVGYLVDDPRREDYGKPLAYRYTPSRGGNQRVIHASRLIRFYGDDVPEQLADRYDGWGAPCVESVWGTFSSAMLALDGGAELLAEVGMTVFTIDNLKEIQSGGEVNGLGSWMGLIAKAKSTLRSILLAPGQSVERLGMAISGWSEVYDRIAQELSAETGMPITKLYGQAPGGLSTDDASAWRNWSSRVEDYQQDVLVYAYLYLLEVMCAAKEGACKGQRPEILDVELAPYEVPTEVEEAEIANKWSATVNTLVMAGIMDEDEARETMRRVKGVRLQEEEQGDDLDAGQALLASLMPDTPMPSLDTSAPAPLDSATLKAVSDIVSSVYQGLYPADQGAQLLVLGNPALSLERARQIIGSGPQASTPALQEDRLDAESWTPPKAVQENAKRALEVREQKPESQRGMTDTGIARARDLSNGRPVSLDTLKRMVAYFERHEVDKKGETWDEQGKGWQAWMGWGGDEGWRWAKRIVESQEPKEDATRIDPYASIDDPKLPEKIKALSPRKRRAFIEAFNATFEESEGDEGKAFASGYAASERADTQRHDYGAQSMALCLMPSEEVAAAYAPLSDIPQDELHATLLYLPDVADEDVQAVLECVEAFAAAREPVRMRTSGPGTFINDSIARVMLLDGLGLNEFRTDLKREIEKHDALGLQTHGFTAHMTLGYHTREDYPADLLAEMAKVESDEWSSGEIVAWRNGDIVASLPLAKGESE